MSFSPKADIERLIGKTYADRGAAYAKEGRVIKVSGAEGKRRLIAKVRGGGRSTYSETIALKWSANGRLINIEGECSCPIGYNCKHVAAVLFAAETILCAENYPASPDQPKRSTPPNPPSQSLSGPLQVWLETGPKPQTSGNGNDYPPRVLDRVYYVLNRERDQLVVQPYKVRLKKDGTLGKGARRYDIANVNSPTPPKFLRPIDLRIRRYLQLADSYFYASGTKLPEGEEGQKTLELLLATGRARWREVDGIPLVEGAEQTGRFVWHLDKSGTQTLQVKTSEDKTVIALPVAPLWYLDPKSGECGQLITDQPPERAAWLAAAPPVKAHEVTQFAKVLGQLADAALPLPKQIRQVTRTDILPTPVVRLHAARVQEVEVYDWRYYSRSAPATKQIVPALSCVFDYRGARVHSDDVGSTIEAFDGDRIEVIGRHNSQEARYLSDLENIANVHGFENSDLLEEEVQVDGKDKPDFFLFPFDADGIGPQQALEFLRFGAEKLRNLGWRVEIGKDWPYQMHEGDHKISAGVKEDENGWFTLALNIEVAGQEIDLLAVVLRFLNQMPPEVLEVDFDLAAYLADQTFYLRLADGRYLSLPAGPLAPALKAFLALHGQMHPGEATVVADIAEALAGSNIAFAGGEKLLELGQRLRALAKPDAAPLVPVGFVGELRPYQKIGLGWLTALAQTGFGGVLADDMGLGKTVQALAFLAGRKETNAGDLPNLLVVPTSLVTSWSQEAARFTPDLRVLVLHGPERKALFERIADHDLVITTYPLLHRDADILFAQNYDTVILDEAQMVKNPASRAAKLIRNVNANQRLALSGTPMENNLEELWALYDWLIPGLLGNRKAFQHNFRKPIEKKGDRVAQARLSKRIAPFLLRRTKEQVALDLPPKTVITETITLSGAQRELYETIRIAMDQRVRVALDKKGLAGSRITVLDALLKLRQVCCDPGLVKLPAAREITASAKRTHLLGMLDELMAEGRRVEAIQSRKQDLADALFDPAKTGPAVLSQDEILSLFQPIT